jgi:hypothetical protein
MSWFGNPRFVPVRESIAATLRAKQYHFRRAKRVAFLCGGQESARRTRLSEYIARRRPDFLVFYAEDVWPILTDQDDANALEMEAQLAQLADIVIVIVESEGTFAELGAFSLSQELRSKLLPILPIEHRTAQSFIAKGPVKWIDRESAFGPSIWTDLNTILTAADEVEDRLDRLPKAGPTRIADLVASPKHLLFYICDLVSIFAPTRIEHLEAYCQATLTSPLALPVRLLVGLAQALGLIQPLQDTPYYYRPLDDGRLLTFQYKRQYFDIITLRAEVLEALQRIEAAAHPLHLIGVANGIG